MRSVAMARLKPVVHRNVLITLFVFLIASCGGTGDRSGKSSVSDDQGSAVATGSRYYNYPLNAFPKVTFSTNWNHPDHFSAEYDGKLLTTDHIGTYGTSRTHYTLDLATGFIYSSGQYPAITPEGQTVLQPPDKGGDYFAYEDALSGMQAVLVTVSASEAAAFITKALDQVKSLTTIDALRFVLMGNSPLILGVPTAIQVNYKMAGERDLLVSFCDKSQCYNTERKTLQGQTSDLLVNVPVPTSLTQPATSYITVKLVPKDAEWEKKIVEVIHSVTVENFDYVMTINRYWMHPGESDKAFVSYRTGAAATVALKFYDITGRVVAEARQEIAATDAAGRNAIVYLGYTLPADVAIGDGKVVVRLLAPQGSWENFRSESQSVVRILPVGS